MERLVSNFLNVMQRTAPDVGPTDEQTEKFKPISLLHTADIYDIASMHNTRSGATTSIYWAVLGSC